MYNGAKVIDVHGHMSTPPQFRAFAYNLIALRGGGEGNLQITDEQMETALGRHLRLLDERGIDVQLISPRPVAMMHWEAPFLSEKWTQTTNDVIAQQCRMHPDRYRGVAQLPQSSTLNTSNCVAELDRCVNELGFVGALINPDPGADRQTPGMNAAYWYPLYKRAEELRTPLIVHPSFSRDPRVEILPHSYQYNNFTEETLATLLLENSDVFQRFPDLKIIICHCGGSLRRMIENGTAVKLGPDVPWTRIELKGTGEVAGGSVGITGGHHTHVDAKLDVTNNLFFDACAYDPVFLEAAIKQRGPDNMLFGTEVPGTGSGVMNPFNNRPSDDLIAVIDGMEFLSVADKMKIFHENARRLFPRLTL